MMQSSSTIRVILFRRIVGSSALSCNVHCSRNFFLREKDQMKVPLNKITLILLKGKALA